MRGASLRAAIDLDFVPYLLEYIGRDEPPGSPEQRSHLFIVQCRYEAEWVDPLNKADLRLEDISQPSQHVLMKQHIADFFAGAGMKSRRGSNRIEVFAENVG